MSQLLGIAYMGATPSMGILLKHQMFLVLLLLGVLYTKEMVHCVEHVIEKLIQLFTHLV